MKANLHMRRLDARGFGTRMPDGGISVCIVSHNGYGAISGKGDGFVGGVERQTSILARWLAESGYDVSFVTWHEGGPFEETIDGVRVIKICPKDAGLPGLRFFHPKWTGLVKAMRKANADIYYHNCGECVTGQMALWCRLNGKKLVFAVASNADCDPHLPEMKRAHERFLFRYGLRNADGVITQTRTQQRMLEASGWASSVVMPMACPGPSDRDFKAPASTRPRVLWVGRVCPVKRLEWLLLLAELSPDWQFDIVGPFDGSGYANRIEKSALLLPNVHLHGKVDAWRISGFYQQTDVLCCTSIYEGFPNTFLEAWSMGIPVISTFDPDGLIVERNLGRSASDVAGMKVALEDLLTNRESWVECSENSRLYFAVNHSLEKALPRVRQFILAVATGARVVADPCPAAGID